MNLFIETHLTQKQVLCLPFFTPFSVRHLAQDGWLNKVIGAIELIPLVSLVATGIEVLVRCFAQKQADFSALKYLQGVRLGNTYAGALPLVVIVADKGLFMQHSTGEYHPESPQRVEAIEIALKAANAMSVENTLPPRQATVEEISLCHDKYYQRELKRQIESLPHLYKEHASFDSSQWKVEDVAGDFIISPKTGMVALYAAGAPLTAIEAILESVQGELGSEIKRAFCIVRPPGHHAHPHTGSGFCVYNNVAIAAKYLTKKRGFKSVLIVDWDAHHGDGTQDLTEGDSKIFYFSTHWDTSDGFYPGPHWGKAEQQGVASGKGTVLNCPVSGTQEECRLKILEAFHTSLVPAMEKFQPEFVLISCGFDAHEKDPLVGLGLTDEDFAEMTRICVEIAEKYAQGRIVSVLEGGYDLEAIAGAAKAHVQALQGSPN